MARGRGRGKAVQADRQRDACGTRAWEPSSACKWRANAQPVRFSCVREQGSITERRCCRRHPQATGPGRSAAAGSAIPAYRQRRTDSPATRCPTQRCGVNITRPLSPPFTSSKTAIPPSCDTSKPWSATSPGMASPAAIISRLWPPNRRFSGKSLRQLSVTSRWSWIATPDQRMRSEYLQAAVEQPVLFRTRRRTVSAAIEATVDRLEAQGVTSSDYFHQAAEQPHVLNQQSVSIRRKSDAQRHRCIARVRACPALHLCRQYPRIYVCHVPAQGRIR